MIGILGGTFDPVHFGHVHAALCFRRVFEPDRMLLMPCALPPHKSRRDLTSADHRLAMLRLAVENVAGLEVSTVELERGGISFTLDTLRALADSHGSPVFVVGMDSLIEIQTWRSYAELLRDFDLVAVDRPGRDLELAREELDAEVVPRLVPVRDAPGAGRRVPPPPPGAGGRVYLLPIPPLRVSSSEVRTAAMKGEPLDGLVPPPVARYIHRERLYPQEESR